ncbi:hypothetical protein [Streptomyces sp. NPDC060322]|uniref:hypothetical protein n=1 Tax=Streptomyces sp. NPDC060322 TaxID=3347097 RepID=UPI003659709E
MPRGLTAPRSSRCVACLVTAVGVALGPSSWAHDAWADARAHGWASSDHGAASSRTGHLAHAKPSASPSPSSSPLSSPGSAKESPLAGRQAAEGRARPGRALSPLEAAESEAAADAMPPDPDPVEVPAFTPPPGAFPEPGETERRRQRQALDEPALRQVRDVSLGTGIAMVGLGLAFLAFRMRRTG